MSILFLWILAHAKTHSSKCQLIWICFGLILDLNKFDWIPNLFEFIVSKIAKVFYSVFAYFQDSIDIFISIKFHLYPSIIFLQLFSILENGKGIQKGEFPAAQAIFPLRPLSFSPRLLSRSPFHHNALLGTVLLLLTVKIEHTPHMTAVGREIHVQPPSPYLNPLGFWAFPLGFLFRANT